MDSDISAPPPEKTVELLVLARFCGTVGDRPDLAARVKACTTPEEILAIAAELNCLFSRQLLRERSRDLAADWWPWAQKGTPWRRQFFQG